MRTTVNQRIKAFLDSQHIPVSQFEKACGFSNGWFRNRVREPKEDKLAQIFQAYPDLNPDYVRYGEEPMLLSQKSDAQAIIPHNIVNVPIVSQYAYGGYLTGYADPEYVSTLPVIPFLADREMTGNYVAFEVHGDSMDDGTKHGFEQGEIVICREVEPYLWRDSKLHINRRDFVIVHNEGILIKRITDHNLEDHTITIHSLNPLYPDRILNLSDVHQIFSIITSQLRRDR